MCRPSRETRKEWSPSRLPENLAIGSLRWQLVRLISTAELDGSGTFSESDPLEFAGNVLRISPPPQMAATLTRTGVEFVRQNSNVSEINLVDILGKGYDFAGTRLTGGKVQPIVFADDLSRAYVAGKGAVHVIDTLSFKLVGTIAVPAGKNIVSLATVGSLLFIGEGDRFAGGAPYRLLAVDINPGSARFNQVVTLKDTGIESTPYGVSGMASRPGRRDTGRWHANQSQQHKSRQPRSARQRMGVRPLHPGHAHRQDRQAGSRLAAR
jgi:hypothetical protein